MNQIFLYFFAKNFLNHKKKYQLVIFNFYNSAIQSKISKIIHKLSRSYKVIPI